MDPDLPCRVDHGHVPPLDDVLDVGRDGGVRPNAVGVHQLNQFAL